MAALCCVRARPLNPGARNIICVLHIICEWRHFTYVNSLELLVISASSWELKVKLKGSQVVPPDAFCWPCSISVSSLPSLSHEHCGWCWDTTCSGLGSWREPAYQGRLCSPLHPGLPLLALPNTSPYLAYFLPLQGPRVGSSLGEPCDSWGCVQGLCSGLGHTWRAPCWSSHRCFLQEQKNGD